MSSNMITRHGKGLDLSRGEITPPIILSNISARRVQTYYFPRNAHSKKLYLCPHSCILDTANMLSSIAHHILFIHLQPSTFLNKKRRNVKIGTWYIR